MRQELNKNGRRLLIYSHDSFGLGHLRRCRSIAHNLVNRDPGLQVMIVSGLPLVARFEFHPRIQITLVPEIIKLKSGDYRALDPDQSLSDAIGLRSRVIRETAERFAPDLVLVDKEPLGIRGEMHATLEYLRAANVPAILGLRDVMDEPIKFAAEWARKGAVDAIDQFYREIWVYGLRQIFDPLAGLPLSPGVRERVLFTSYLRRSEATAGFARALTGDDRRYLLVTPGGGGDGEELVDWVVSAREWRDRQGWPPLMPLKIVSGPFMSGARRAEFERRAARLGDVTFADFDPDLEGLMAGAAGVVAMGGYNTFCEILSYDRPALIVPRTAPRLEQFIRAERACELGLVAMLPDDGVRDPARMAEALAALPFRARPSAVTIPGLLDGHRMIASRVDLLLDGGRAAITAAAG
jgi:predicted glycosyltransferase